MPVPIAAQFHFGCVFIVRGAEGRSPTWGDLAKMVRAWIAAKNQRTRDLASPRFYLGGEWRPPGAPRVSVRTERAIGSGSEHAPEYWAVRYEHPCDKVPFRQWRTDIGITALHDASFRFALSTIHWLLPGYIGEEPLAPVPTAPRIVSTIIDSPVWSASAGSERLRSTPDVLNPGTAPALVARLQDRGRECPIVLVTREFETGRLKLDTGRLSRLLAGTATVVEAGASAVDKELEWFLPESFRCWNGMVRVYQSSVRFDSSADSRRHRFFKRDQIEALTPEAVENMIVQGVARRTRALASDGVLVSVDDVISKQRELRLVELRQQTDDTSLREQLGIQEELLAAFVHDNKEISAKLRELQEQLEGVEIERADQEERINSLTFEKERLRRAAVEADGRTKRLQASREALATLRKLPESLLEMIELIERLWPDRIVFSERAKTSAKRAALNSVRAEIGEAWRCIVSMAIDLHELLFSGVNLKGDIAQNFRERTGFELTMTEGKQTKSDKKLLKLRKIQYGGTEVDITPHVKWGNKPPRCLRVHFYPDHEKRILVVGHCGDHLDTYGTQWVR